MNTHRSAQRNGQAALTPLLDTLFLLLFALLATSESREAASQEVEVSLPSLESDGESASAEPDAPLGLEIDAEGAVRSQARSVGTDSRSFRGPQELRAWLASQESGRAVEIRADSDARHAVVVEVLHELQQLGFLNVRFVAVMATEPGADAGASTDGPGWGSKR